MSVYSYPNCPSFCKKCEIKNYEIQCLECDNPNMIILDSFCACKEGYEETSEGICKSNYNTIQYNIIITIIIIF